MNVIMNYVKPSTGAVSYLDGLKYTSKNNEVKLHQQISMMPEQSDLYNHLSGRAHMKMYAMMWGNDKKLITKQLKL